MTAGRRGALAALSLQTVLAAATYLAAKRSLGEIDPWTVAMLRFAISSAAFLLLLALGGDPRPPRALLPRLLFLGLLAVSVNQLLFLEGLAHSVPSHAALLYALTPIGVRAIERLRGASASGREVLGLALALGGAVLVLLRPGQAFEARPLLGDAMLLVAMVAWALYTVHSKPLVEKHGALRVSAWTLLAGVLVTAPFGVPALAAVRRASFSGIAWFGVFYLALVTSVACYALWNFGLGRLRAPQVAVFSNLQPPIAALFSWAILGERLTAALFAGGALVLAGVLLTQLEGRRPPPARLEAAGGAPVG